MREVKEGLQVNAFDETNAEMICTLRRMNVLQTGGCI